jgi:uncharacterized protein YdcH (DUF465 family)
LRNLDKGGLAMERIPHGLDEEFPNEKNFIGQLTRTSREFRRISTEYDEVNRQIYRIESEEEPTSDEVLERLKKRRLKLKDYIAAMLFKLKRRM